MLFKIFFTHMMGNLCCGAHFVVMWSTFGILIASVFYFIISNEDLQLDTTDMVKAACCGASRYKTAHCLHNPLSNT